MFLSSDRVSSRTAKFLTGVGAVACAVTVSRAVEQSQSKDSSRLILEALFCVGDSCSFHSKGTKESSNSAWLQGCFNGSLKPQWLEIRHHIFVVLAAVQSFHL